MRWNVKQLNVVGALLMVSVPHSFQALRRTATSHERSDEVFKLLCSA